MEKMKWPVLKQTTIHEPNIDIKKYESKTIQYGGSKEKDSKKEQYEMR